MARELGMNPAKLGKLDNHHQEEWKVPLPQFIEEIYTKRFGKTVPDSVIPLEERIRRDSEKKHSCWHSRGTAELSEAVIQGKIGETATSNPPVHKEFSPSRELAFRLKYS
jgi:hypothetical protein